MRNYHFPLMTILSERAKKLGDRLWSPLPDIKTEKVVEEKNWKVPYACVRTRGETAEIHLAATTVEKLWCDALYKNRGVGFADRK